MLRSLRVENFKCLRDTGEVTLEPITVLIGKNDTGKTSFLEALWALSQVVGQRDWARSELADRIRRGAGDEGVRWTSEWDLDGVAHTYSAEVRGLPSGRITLSAERLSDASGHVRYAVDPSGTFRGVVPAAAIWPSELPLLSAQAAAGDKRAVDVLAGLNGVSHPFSLANRSPTALAAMLDEILGEDRKAFDALEAALCDAFPNLKGISLRRTQPVPAPRTLMFKIDGEVSVPGEHASGGILAFTALLAEVFRVGSDPHSVLLIEEPENGVHPGRLRLLAEHLQRLSARAQIVLATHSPYFLDYFPASAVRVFGRTRDGDVMVRNLSDLPLVKTWLAEGNSLGEMWFNVGEDRLLDLDDGSAPRLE